MLSAPMGETYLSGYRLMWMIVLFDLPVVDPDDRRAAVKFRDNLLDHGFAMAQFSVYMKMLPGKEAGEALIPKIEAAAPPNGTIQVIMITDKQYENIKTFRNRTPYGQENPGQLLLF